MKKERESDRYKNIDTSNTKCVCFRIDSNVKRSIVTRYTLILGKRVFFITVESCYTIYGTFSPPVGRNYFSFHLS